MRELMLLSAVTAFFSLAACNQSQPADETAGDAKTEAPSNMLQPRVNMAPVAPGKAKAVMHERHEGMEKVGKLMKQLARDMKAEPLDLAAVRSSAAGMNTLAQRAANWFPAGTGPDVGKTGAKPEIWQKPQDFVAKMAAFQKAAGAFHGAAKGGNVAATKAAYGDLGQACKACHDDYRTKMKH